MNLEVLAEGSGFWGMTKTKSGATPVRVEFKAFSPPVFRPHIERRQRNRPPRCRTRKVKSKVSQWARAQRAAFRTPIVLILDENPLKTVTK